MNLFAEKDKVKAAIPRWWKVWDDIRLGHTDRLLPVREMLNGCHDLYTERNLPMYIYFVNDNEVMVSVPDKTRNIAEVIDHERNVLWVIRTRLQLWGIRYTETVTPEDVYGHQENNFQFKYTDLIYGGAKVLKGDDHETV